MTIEPADLVAALRAATPEQLGEIMTILMAVPIRHVRLTEPATFGVPVAPPLHLTGGVATTADPRP